MIGNDNDPPIQIVELSDEASALLRHQYELDRDEAGPKLPIDSLLYRGVKLGSRFSVAAEFETMKRVIDEMVDLVRVRVESICCDSRAGADYAVTVAPNRWVEGIEREIRDAFLRATEGFNGLTVLGSDRDIWFDPIWVGDEDS